MSLPPSGVKGPASRIPHPKSHIPRSTPHVPRHVPYLTSDVPYPTSLRHGVRCDDSFAERCRSLKPLQPGGAQFCKGITLLRYHVGDSCTSRFCCDFVHIVHSSNTVRGNLVQEVVGSTNTARAESWVNSRCSWSMIFIARLCLLQICAWRIHIFSFGWRKLDSLCVLNVFFVCCHTPCSAWQASTVALKFPNTLQPLLCT